MGTRKPRPDEYLPHCFAVRLAAEPSAHRYLQPYLARLKGRHYVQPWNSVSYIFIEDLPDACRLILSCIQLRLIGTDEHDMPVPPAESGGNHFTVRLVMAIEGTRDDPRNKATSEYLARVRHRYALTKGILNASGTRVVRMYLPTLRDAVDLVRACPHLVLAADRYDGRSQR